MGKIDIKEGLKVFFFIELKNVFIKRWNR